MRKKRICNAHRVSRVVPVSLPLLERRPPVLEQELFGILLAAAVTVAALGGRAGDAVRPVKVNLDPLTHARLDHLLRAPSSAMDVLTKPLRTRKRVGMQYYA